MNQVPVEIAEVSPEPRENHPTADDKYSTAAVAVHIRTLYAFIARLQAQIDELKPSSPSNSSGA